MVVAERKDYVGQGVSITLQKGTTLQEIGKAIKFLQDAVASYPQYPEPFYKTG